MADFGFGSLVEKYEEYFGRNITRIIQIVVGFAVVATGVGAIWTWLVSPLLAFFRTPVWGTTLTQLALTVIAIGGGISLSFSISQELARFRHTRAIKRLRSEAKRDFGELMAETRQQTDEMLDRAALTSAKGDEIFELSNELFHKLLEIMPNLTEEERAEWLIKASEIHNRGSS